MSYEKFYPGGWQSGESGGTPITPEALNHIESGIKQTYSDFAPAGIVSKTIKIANETELDNALTEETNAMANDSARFLVFAPTNSSIFDGIATLCRLYKRSYSGYGTADFIGYSTYGTNVWRKSWYGGVWQPLEWGNPPMIPGVEYRTTERWNGKPVYVKMVNFGALPNSSTKSVPHGIVGKSDNVRYELVAQGTWLLLNKSASITHVTAGDTNIIIDTDDYFEDDISVYVVLWYTKN